MFFSFYPDRSWVSRMEHQAPPHEKTLTKGRLYVKVWIFLAAVSVFCLSSTFATAIAVCQSGESGSKLDKETDPLFSLRHPLMRTRLINRRLSFICLLVGAVFYQPSAHEWTPSPCSVHNQQIVICWLVTRTGERTEKIRPTELGAILPLRNSISKRNRHRS